MFRKFKAYLNIKDNLGTSENSSVQFSAVTQSCLTVWNPMHAWQHARLPCPPPTLGCPESNSCPSAGDAIQPFHPLV